MQVVKANNQRIARNTVFLYVRMFFVLIVSLYTSRVVLNTLGVSDFGVYTVVGGFVSLFGFLNATLSSSMSRFYNYEGGQRGDEGVREVYTSGFWIHILLTVVILLLLETFGLWYVNNVLVVPPDRLQATNVIYQCSIFSMALVILEIPYTSAIMSYERMDFYAVVSIIDVVLKLLIVLALPFIGQDKLILYAFLILGITLFDFLLYFIYAKKKFAAIRLNNKVNRSLFKSFLSFSGWNLLGTFAFLLKGQGVNLLLNSFFGPVVNAARGIAYQVNAAVYGFSSNINVAFRPQIVDSVASKSFARSTRLMFMESNICYCMIFVIFVPLILEIDYVLGLWLGDVVPTYTSIFTVLVLIDALICSLNAPLTHIAHAVGTIKYYQIANSSVNILLLPASWFLLHLGLSPVSVFLCTIFFSMLNQTVCLHELHKLYEYSSKAYFRDVICPCVLVTLIIPIIPILFHLLMTVSFNRLLLESIASLVSGVVCAYFWMIDKNGRTKVQNYIRNSVGGHKLYRNKILK